MNLTIYIYMRYSASRKEKIQHQKIEQGVEEGREG